MLNRPSNQDLELNSAFLTLIRDPAPQISFEDHQQSPSCLAPFRCFDSRVTVWVREADSCTDRNQMAGEC